MDGLIGISLSFSFSVKKLLKLTIGTNDDVAQLRLDICFFFIQTDPMV
jgi:hypothetical protein